MLVAFPLVNFLKSNQSTKNVIVLSLIWIWGIEKSLCVISYFAKNWLIFSDMNADTLEIVCRKPHLLSADAANISRLKEKLFNEEGKKFCCTFCLINFQSYHFFATYYASC